MDKSKKIYYGNVVPTVNNKTVNIQFKDNNDIIIEEKKRKDVNFAKKLNNFFFSIISCFFIFIIISLYKTYFDYNKKKAIDRKNILIDRGKILDRNGEIIATNIKTKDLYLDTRKVLNNSDLKHKLKQIFPEKNNFFL